MKNILTVTILFLFIAITAKGQEVPENINYQTLIRNNDGAYVSNENVAILLSIISGTPSGTSIYSEAHLAQTNDYGLVNLKIGTGASTDDFSSIDWSSGSFFLNIEVSVGNNGLYEDLGTTPFSSVPYALYAKNANIQLEAGEGIEVTNKKITAKNNTALWNANSIQNIAVAEQQPNTGDVLVYDGSKWIPGTQNTLPANSSILSFDAEAPDGYTFSGNTITTKKTNGIWNSAASISDTRRYVAPCQYNGMLYTFGGESRSSFTTNLSQRYNPSTDTWELLNPMPTSRVHSSAVELGGLIYISGGFINNTTSGSSSVDVYNPVENTYSSIPSFNQMRWAHYSFTYNGKLYIAGGVDRISNGSFVNTIEEYNPTTNSWSTIYTTPDLHIRTKMIALNGVLYFVYSSPEQGIFNTYSLNMATLEWKTLPQLNTTRSDFAIGTIGNYLVVSGGWYNRTFCKTTELFYPQNGSWVTINADILTPLYGARGAEVNNQFIITGGVDENGEFVNETQVFELTEIEEQIFIHKTQ